MATYDYSITAHTGGAVAVSKLADELTAVLGSTPDIITKGDLLRITSAPLGQGSAILQVLQSHDGIARTPRVLAHYEGASAHFHAIDYIRSLEVRLHPVRTFVDGELREVCYFDDVARDEQGNPALDVYGLPTYSADALVVKESYSYTREPGTDFAVYRQLVISWMCEDGSEHPETKTRLKFYPLQERVVESRTRRTNVVNKLEVDTAGMLVVTEVQLPQTDPGYAAAVEAALLLGKQWLATNKLALDLFVEGADPAVIVSIQTAAESWFDNDLSALGMPGVTIRQAMLAAFSKWMYLLP